MVFRAGDFEYIAGNVVAAPRLGRFPLEDGLYQEVVWLTVAVDHPGAATEYVDLEARGRTKEYIKNLASSPVDPLTKGTFVIDGGKLTRPRDNKRRKLRLVAISARTSLGYKILDSDGHMKRMSSEEIARDWESSDATDENVKENRK